MIYFILQNKIRTKERALVFFPSPSPPPGRRERGRRKMKYRFVYNIFWCAKTSGMSRARVELHGYLVTARDFARFIFARYTSPMLTVSTSCLKESISRARPSCHEYLTLARGTSAYRRALYNNGASSREVFAIVDAYSRPIRCATSDRATDTIVIDGSLTTARHTFL